MYIEYLGSNSLLFYIGGKVGLYFWKQFSSWVKQIPLLIIEPASSITYSRKFSRLFFASFPSNNWLSIVHMRVYNCKHKFIILPAVLWIRILKDPNLFCRIRIHICCRCDLVHVRIRVRKNGTCQFKLFVLFNDEQKRLKNLSAFLKIHYLHFTTEDIHLQYKHILININNCVTF